MKAQTTQDDEEDRREPDDDAPVEQKQADERDYHSPRGPRFKHQAPTRGLLNTVDKRNLYVEHARPLACLAVMRDMAGRQVDISRLKAGANVELIVQVDELAKNFGLSNRNEIFRVLDWLEARSWLVSQRSTPNGRRTGAYVLGDIYFNQHQGRRVLRWRTGRWLPDDLEKEGIETDTFKSIESNTSGGQKVLDSISSRTRRKPLPALAETHVQ